MNQDAQLSPSDPKHPSTADLSLSVVVPAYNEEEVLPELQRSRQPGWLPRHAEQPLPMDGQLCS